MKKGEQGKKGRWTAVAGLVVILVMVLGAAAVFAQDDATPEAPALPFGHHGFHGFDGFHGRGSANDEALAEALGITVEELEAARQKAAAERLSQAVEDGYLTREQANEIIAMQAMKGYLDRQAILAQALGLNIEALEKARTDGTLRDLLADITPAELQEKLQTALAAAVQQAVADNVITAEQAALVLERAESSLQFGHKFSPNFQMGPGLRFDEHHGFSRGRGYHNFDGSGGLPQSDEDGETFAPFGGRGMGMPFGA